MIADDQRGVGAGSEGAGKADRIGDRGQTLHGARHIEAHVHVAHLVAFPGVDRAAPDLDAEFAHHGVLAVRAVCVRQMFASGLDPEDLSVVISAFAAARSARNTASPSSAEISVSAAERPASTALTLCTPHTTRLSPIDRARARISAARSGALRARTVAHGPRPDGVSRRIVITFVEAARPRNADGSTVAREWSCLLVEILGDIVRG